MRYQNIQIEKYTHDTFVLRGSKVVYLDPYKLPDNAPPADIICVTHEHFDHFSINDIKRLSSAGSYLVAAKEIEGKLKGVNFGHVELVTPGRQIEIEGVMIKALPAYNIDKEFHPKDDEKVGYLITLDGVKVYHAGDSDFIPEMAQLADEHIDVALLPVSGTYVMDWAEAVRAVEAIKPKLAIPMHYGEIVGSEEDAKRFQESAGCPVEII